MKNRLAEELQASFDKVITGGKAEVMAGMTYTALFGLAAAGVAHVGQGTTLGFTGQCLLSGIMFACAKITSKDIERLGKTLAEHRRDAESLNIRLK